MREELELGPPPPNVQLEGVGQWVSWGPELQLVQEGPPLSPLQAEPMDLDGTKQVQEDGAMAEEDAAGE